MLTAVRRSNGAQGKGDVLFPRLLPRQGTPPSWLVYVSSQNLLCKHKRSGACRHGFQKTTAFKNILSQTAKEYYVVCFFHLSGVAPHFSSPDARASVMCSGLRGRSETMPVLSARRTGLANTAGQRQQRRQSQIVGRAPPFGSERPDSRGCASNRPLGTTCVATRRGGPRPGTSLGPSRN